jgi:NTE family protein
MHVTAPVGNKRTARRMHAIQKEQPLPSMIELLLTSLHVMQVHLTESRLQIERPEVLIRPPLGSVHVLEFDRAEEMIAIGYRSALDPLRTLRRSMGTPLNDNTLP